MSSEPFNPVARYCALFAQSGLTAERFAQHARAYRPALVEAVLNIIGHWPSSEPELRALQVRP